MSTEHPIFQALAALDALHDAAQADYLAEVEEEQDRRIRRSLWLSEVALVLSCISIVLSVLS